MMKSTETQTYKSSFEVILCDQSTQTDEDFHEQVVISRSPEEDPSQEEITKEIASPNKDPSYVPCQMTQTTRSQRKIQSLLTHKMM